MARIPAYKQLYTDLKQSIKNGKYKPGTFLPTESEMCEEYQVSRTTVRKAISMLTNEGYLSVTQGRGTQVQDISTSQHLNTITSLTETLKQRGYKVTTQGLACEKIPAPPFIREIFSLNEGSYVYHIQRVQCADGRPICIIENYLIADMIPNFVLPEKSNDNVSLYECLEKEYGIILKDAIEHISAVGASFLEAQILGIPTNAPLLHSTRITYTDHGPFEYASTHIISDRYEYQIYLSGRS